MGKIKDGCIYGFLPSKSSNFVVHYPGYPSSTARAVETLGGTDAILKARSSQSNKLELHFRPEDPYSHPAFGEIFPCNNFLLKLSKHNGDNGQIDDDSNRLPNSLSTSSAHAEQIIGCSVSMGDADTVCQSETECITVSAKGDANTTEEEVEENLFADIVGRVSEAYRFNGMVDYQHVLAVHADVARKKKRNWADVEPQFEKRGLIDVDQEDLMILVPPLFSPKDIPERVVLKPCMDVSLKKKQEGAVQHRWEMEIEPCLALDFNIKEIPKKINWEKYIPQGSDQYEWQMCVCKLFDEKPIWIKHSLIDRLLDKGIQFGGYTLRRLLFRAAYYFSNGPFLRFWIRKGYDPRKDPESRIFQRTDFRVPPPLRSYCDNHIGQKHRWKDICKFQVFPYKCQSSLQLIELVDDYIQQEIIKPPTQEKCSLQTGWFSSHVLDTFRLCVAVKFLSVYPKPGAESVLKAASLRLEKSKKTKVLAKEQIINQEGQQEVNTVVEERETNDDEADNDEEEDDVEDENADDELEEALEMAGEESDFSLQPDAYQENISKNYLQELFCSFPFSEAAGKEMQDIENSDDEYQIFEEFSDGNHSDEDY